MKQDTWSKRTSVEKSVPRALKMVRGEKRGLGWGGGADHGVKKKGGFLG